MAGVLFFLCRLDTDPRLKQYNYPGVCSLCMVRVNQ